MDEFHIKRPINYLINELKIFDSTAVSVSIMNNDTAFPVYFTHVNAVDFILYILNLQFCHFF